MTDPTQQEWLANRLDRLESKMDERMERLSNELKDTRHALRPMIETAVTAVAQQEVITRGIEKDIAGIEEWRREDGTLDQRQRRHQDEVRQMVRDSTIEIKASIAEAERNRESLDKERRVDWDRWRSRVDAAVEQSSRDKWYREGGWKVIAIVGSVTAVVAGGVGAVFAALIEAHHLW